MKFPGNLDDAQLLAARASQADCRDGHGSRLGELGRGAGRRRVADCKDELEQLAERGDLRRVDQGCGFRYVPDFTRLYTERIRELALTCSREKLLEEIVQAKEEVQEIQSEFGVESRAELEASLSDQEVSATQARNRQRSLREWEVVADELQLLEHALSLYDDLHDVDPSVEGGADEESPETRAASDG